MFEKGLWLKATRERGVSSEALSSYHGEAQECKGLRDDPLWMVRGILSALLGEYIELQGRMWFTSPRPVPPLAVGVNVSSAKAEVLLASPLPQPLLRFCPDLYYHLTEMTQKGVLLDLIFRCCLQTGFFFFFLNFKFYILIEG